VSAFAVLVCANGHAVYPPRLLCPVCASDDWHAVAAPAGTVEEVTEVAGTRIASVRSEAGPRVVARAEGELAPGDAVALRVEGGAVVALGPNNDASKEGGSGRRRRSR
jgi:uncharacterized OB-fold protein